MFLFIYGLGVEPSPLLLLPFIGLFYQLWKKYADDCGAVSGMSGNGNGSTRRKTAPLPLCSPRIPHDLTWARTRAAAVRRRGLTPGLRHGSLYVPASDIKLRFLCPLLSALISVTLVTGVDLHVLELVSAA
jgi:hypothetical protein